MGIPILTKRCLLDEPRPSNAARLLAVIRLAGVMSCWALCGVSYAHIGHFAADSGRQHNWRQLTNHTDQVCRGTMALTGLSVLITFTWIPLASDPTGSQQYGHNLTFVRCLDMVSILWPRVSMRPTRYLLHNCKWKCGKNGHVVLFGCLVWAKLIRIIILTKYRFWLSNRCTYYDLIQHLVVTITGKTTVNVW